MEMSVMRARSLLFVALLGFQPSTAPAQTVDASYLDLVSWRMVGPTRGGRVLAVAGDPQHDFTFYQGTAGGGVWKTEDGGLNWSNVSDGSFHTGSVGAIALAASNSDIVYVGMGEACIRGNASIGDGVYRSTDAGRTWTHIGLAATSQIARVRVHPTNPDLVYVAALGTPWGPSPDRGVYRSRDGGATWEKVLFRDDDTGAIDLIMDPTNPDVLYASLLQLRRYPWGFTSAGPGTGLFKSTDGGDTWTELTDRPGLPDGLKGRIGITVSPARPDRLWAIIDAELGKKGVFRSDDAGDTWTRVNDNADLTQRPWYYHHIFADTKDPNTVYVLNVRFWKSSDGGETFELVQAPHGDNHDLWIDPENPLRMINANDGGATVSFNGGQSWSSIMNQPTAQLYHVAVDNGFPYRLYASQQDNTTISVPSRSDYGSVTVEDWYTVGGGEDGYVAPRTDDPNIVYAGDHHWLYRYDHSTKQIRDISPNPETYYGWGAADMLYRFWWTYPVMTSPHDPDVLYVTSQFVHRTTNEGQSWEVVSPDLTRADPSTIERTPSYEHPEPGQYWGPITREAYGPEWYATVFAFAESPAQAGVLWAGSDDGFIHVSRDNGANWTKVNIPDLPEFALISIIEPGHHDAASAYVAATRYKLDDQTPYLYKTKDYGATWTRITTGIPANDFTRVIREDPARPGLLYAGTERTLYVSFDDGAHWQPLNHNLPVVPVHDIQVKEGDLAIATHGRSFWILDNVALLHQLSAAAMAEPVHLFRPRNTIRFRDGADLVANYAGGGAAGRNPPSGVVVPYYFHDRPTGSVTLRILKGSEVVRSVENAPARQGANTWIWNMRYPGARVLDDAVFQGSPQGPLAAPGTYTVELVADGRTQRQDFQILRDPRIHYTDADLMAQHDFLIGVRDRLSETMDLVKEIRDLRTEAERLVEAGGNRQELVEALKRLNDKLYPLEERLVQYRARAGQDLIAQPTGIDSKLARLMNFASMADAPPTDGEQELFQRLVEGIRERAEALARIREEEYAELVRRARLVG
ncbi:MAG: glycosyl hydrolase [Gemmatimonadota bacterium]